MKLEGKVVVVTGGANGIGRAFCERFVAERPAAIVVADLEGDRAQEVADRVGGVAHTVDVGKEADIVALVDRTIESYGRIDVFCSNAGIGGGAGGVDLSNETWERVFGVNFHAHLYAARAVLPAMLERGEGYLVNTISAAGLLTSLGSAPYAVTKHAALAFAEWLRITHGERGIRVSCLCPQGVRTRMLLGDDLDNKEHFLAAGSVSPDEVADCVVEAIDDERFLILPHPEVAEYFRRKGTDYDRWLRGMQRLQARVSEGYQLEKR